MATLMADLAAENFNRAALLPELARHYGDREAIVEGSGPRRRSISFRGFAQRTAALAAGFEQLGLKAGDRVLVFVPMSIELYLVLMACLHAGLCVAFVDAWADKKRLDQAVALVKPRAFIGSLAAQALRLFSPAIRRIEIKLAVGGRFFPLERLERPELARPPLLRNEEDEALVTLTTGSTGRPKAEIGRAHV